MPRRRKRTFGTKSKVLEAAQTATLLLDMTGGTAGNHNALTVNNTLEDILDVSPGQVLSSDTGVARGDLIYSGTAGSWNRLALGAASAVLASDGTDVAYRTLFDNTSTIHIAASNAADAGSLATAARIDHRHAVNAVSDAATSPTEILKSDANGYLQLQRLGAGTAPTIPLHALATTEQLRLNYDAAGYASFTVADGGTLTIDTTTDNATGDITMTPARDVVLDPGSNEVGPGGTIEDDLGAYDNMWRTIYAAELYVETLVAQDVLATIGGRIMVAPTTYLTASLLNTNHVINPGFETAGIGGFGSWDEFPLGTDVISQDGTIKHAGSYSCKIDSNDANASYVVQAEISLTGGVTYHLSFYTRGDGTEQGAYRVYDTTDVTDLIAKTDTGVTGTTFTLVSVVFTVGGSDSHEISLYFYGPDAVGDVWFDTSAIYYGEIETEHNDLSNNDYVIMKAAPSGVAQTEVMQVVSAAVGSGPYIYDVKRNVDGSGINSWVEGDAVVNLGYAAGEGYIDLCSTSTIHNDLGPVISIYTRTGTTNWNDTNPVVAMGNLESFLDYTSDEFGFAVADDLGLSITAAKGIAVDRTNGVRIINSDIIVYSAGVEQLRINSAGIKLVDDTSGTNDIFWHEPGTSDVSGGMYVDRADPTDVIEFYIQTDPQQQFAAGSYIYLQAYGAAGDITQLSVDTTNAAVIVSNDDAGIYGDFRAEGGLAVGGVGIDPALGQIIMDQKAGDGIALEIRSDDVTHGITDYADTNTFGYMQKAQATSGGLVVRGLKDADGDAGYALMLSGMLGEAADTTKTSAALGVIELQASVKSGTGVAAVGTDGNLVVIHNLVTNKFIFDAEGSAHADVEWVTFDDHDDIVLLSALEQHATNGDPIKDAFGAFLEYNKDALQTMKLAHFEDDRPGHAMVNFTRLSMLLTGAVKQLNDRLNRYEQALIDLGTDPKLLN